MSHDRVAHLRQDDDWLAEAWSEPAAQALVLVGTRLRPRRRSGGPDWISTSEAPTGLRVLLGRGGDAARFAVIVDPAQAASTIPGYEAGEWVGLRSVFTALMDAEGGVLPEAAWLFHAVGLAEWHRATRFCPRCGERLVSRAAGHELHCQGCGKTQFPRTDPAVIMAISDGEPGTAHERILLGRNATWPTGRWSTLAGFCEPGESLEDAVRREVLEESGVRVGEVTYFGSQPWPLPSSLMLGFTGRASDPTIDLRDSELEDARWFTRGELRAAFATGEIKVPRSISISSQLIDSWYGEPRFVDAGWS